MPAEMSHASVRTTLSIKPNEQWFPPRAHPTASRESAPGRPAPTELEEDVMKLAALALSATRRCCGTGSSAGPAW